MAETDARNLEVQEKKELPAEQEKTQPGRHFIPTTDIYERDDALVVVMEMPGVDKSGVEVGVEDDVLRIEGRIDSSKYAELQPVYTEYNIGNFSRRFTLSNKIDQAGIEAGMKDGVLTVTLPKAADAQPRKITIN